MKKKLTILLYLLLLLFLGCRKVEPVDIEIELSKEDMIYEYDYIFRFLEENYPYLSVLKNRNIDYKIIEEEYREKIKNVENFVDYYDLLQEIMNEKLEGEAHLVILDPSSFKAINNLYKDIGSFDNFTKKEYEFSIEPFLDKESIKRYEDLDKKVKKGEDFYSEENKMTIEKFDDTLVVDYNTFMAIDDLKENTEKIRKALLEKEYKNIIFDLRGNIGGDVSGFIDIVELFLDKDMSIEEYHLGKGEKSLEYYKDFEKYTNIVSFEKKLKDGENLFKLREDFKGKKEIKYNPEIYLIMDEDSYSASLKFLEFSKHNNFGKILGEKPVNGGDGGAITYTNLLSHKLPKSKLILQFYTSIRCDEKGEKQDPRISPDIIIEKDMSHEEIIKIIK